MSSSRIKAFAAMAMALVGARAVSAQRGGLAGGTPRFYAYTSLNSLIGVTSPENDSIKVYNIAEGTWSASYRASEGTTVQPIGGIGYIVALPEGPKITQLAAYDIRSKDWIIQDLKEPAADKLEAYDYNMGMAVFIAGRRVYAFSLSASKWGVLELPEGAKPIVNVGQNVATVLHEGILHIFNAKFGRWDNSGDKPK